ALQRLRAVFLGHRLVDREVRHAVTPRRLRDDLRIAREQQRALRLLASFVVRGRTRVGGEQDAASGEDRDPGAGLAPGEEDGVWRRVLTNPTRVLLHAHRDWIEVVTEVAIHARRIPVR